MNPVPAAAQACCLLVVAAWASSVDELVLLQRSTTVILPSQPHTAFSVAKDIPPEEHRAAAAEDGASSPTRGSGLALPEARVRGDVEALRAVGRAHRQAPGITTTSSKSFFDNLKDSLAKFCVGLVLLVFSFPVLWFNEQRSARMDSLVSLGKASVLRCSGEKACKDNRGRLVHLSGENMSAKQAVQDDMFSDVAIKEKCIRLRRKVELYQYIESKHENEREKLGGGTEKVTTYTYTKAWSGIFNGHNKDPQHRNKKPDGLVLGEKTTNCGLVEYGAGFVLNDKLVGQCSGFQRLGEKHLGAELAFGQRSFGKHAGDGWYYSAEAGKRGPAEVATGPCLGDCRVAFEYVTDGQASILALQLGRGGTRGEQEAEAPAETFGPYRLISRGVCGISEEKERAKLIEYAHKTSDELAQENTCTWGPLVCLCCVCNVVAGCCAGFLTAEIHHLWEGALGVEECFQRINQQNILCTWALRLLGWGMMFAGLYMLFSPFLTILAVIPLFKWLAGGAIWILCLIVTLALASSVTFLAYLTYRPLKAFCWAAFVVAIASLIYVAPAIFGKA